MPMQIMHYRSIFWPKNWPTLLLFCLGWPKAPSIHTTDDRDWPACGRRKAGGCRWTCCPRGTPPTLGTPGCSTASSPSAGDNIYSTWTHSREYSTVRSHQRTTFTVRVVRSQPRLSSSTRHHDEWIMWCVINEMWFVRCIIHHRSLSSEHVSSFRAGHWYHVCRGSAGWNPFCVTPRAYYCYYCYSSCCRDDYFISTILSQYTVDVFDQVYPGISMLVMHSMFVKSES